MTNDDLWRWANEQDSRTEKARKIAAKVIERHYDALRKLDDGGDTMNLQKLFEIQRKLDERIIKEHGLEGKNLFDHKLMALKVELAELANEIRIFKYWSKKPPSPKEVILEEFVDVKHFLLSLGLERRWDRFIDVIDYKPYLELDPFENLMQLFENNFTSSGHYLNAWKNFLALGIQLGFTEQEIVDGYMKKNEKNHERQDSGMY
jgi:dimeric dUTPase (all-alpha-NTP-PPase superfamily)